MESWFDSFFLSTFRVVKEAAGPSNQYLNCGVISSRWKMESWFDSFFLGSGLQKKILVPQPNT